MGEKTGDINQLLALASALGWSWETREFRYRRSELFTNLLFGTTLAGIRGDLSSRLEPPWPDLILTAGRRNEPVARWIKKQAGSHCRIVHLGRPWASLESFDLIITTAQYFLPQASNIVHNELPLFRAGQSAVVESAARLRSHLGGKPSPYTALLIGGNSGAYVFTRSKGRELGRLANALARHSDGSLLITDSRRTPSVFFDAMMAEIDSPYYLWRWESDSRRENPYWGYLALADQVIVTADSVSMLTEAISTERPVYLFDPAERDCWWMFRPHNWRHQVVSQRLSSWLVPRRMRRDVGKLQDSLVSAGRAAWLGKGWIDPLKPSQERVNKDLEQSATRVRALFNLY